jgi:hypothetical protein
VCCLEQHFPIVFHTPVIAREVLMCGSCLVASTEVIGKLPDHGRVPNGYGCVAIEDVQDVDALSARLAAIATDPEPIAAVAARGRAYARAAQASAHDPDKLESLLKSVTRRRSSRRKQPAASKAAEAEDARFPITQLAARALFEKSGIPGAREGKAPPTGSFDLPWAREVLAAAEKIGSDVDSSLRPIAAAIKLEIAIAEAESTPGAGNPSDGLDPMFRLRTKRWAMVDGDLGQLAPVRDPQLRMTRFDVSELDDGKAGPAPACPRHVIAFAQVNGERREPLFVSDQTARILRLSDGTRTAQQIAAEIGSEDRQQGLRQIEELFVAGLLWLHEGRD